MTKHYLLLFITIIVISCSHKTHKSSSTYTADTLYEVFVKTALDQDATWQDMADLAYPLADSICEYAANENSFEKRMYAQDWGYMVIGLLSDKYDELEEAGKEVNEADLSKLFGKLTDAMSLWFYTEDEHQPYIWRDHYYNSYQSTKNPKSGFFYLAVTTPTSEKPEPTILILYPKAAEDYPTSIIFAKYKEDSRSEEDQDSRVVVKLEDCSPRDSSDEDYPIIATGDADVVRMMLEYDVAYLIFRSSDTADGIKGEYETAQLLLDPFHKKWDVVVKQKLSSFVSN